MQSTYNVIISTLGLLKKTFVLKSDAANGFSRCITQKNDTDQFSQKNFDF